MGVLRGEHTWGGGEVRVVGGARVAGGGACLLVPTICITVGTGCLSGWFMLGLF